MSLVNDLLEDFNRRRVSPDDNPSGPLANIEVTPRKMSFKNGAPVQPRPNSIAKIAIGLVAMTFGSVIAVAAMLGAGLGLETVVRPNVSSRPPAAFAIYEDPAGPTATEPFSDLQISESQGGADSFDTQNLSTLDWAELTGFGVEAAGDYTRVRIYLSREREYWIQENPDVGEIEVVITKTRLTQALKPHAFRNSGLTLQETHNSSIGLHLLFSLESASQIQSQFVNDGYNPQLILDILPDAPISGPAVRIDELPVASIPAAPPTAKEAPKTAWGTITQRPSGAGKTASEARRSLDRARRLVARNQSREAIAEYIRALSFEPDLHRAREALVGLLIETGQLSAAERHLATGVRRAPSHAEYTLLRAQLLAAMKQPDMAIAILESLPLPPQRRSDSLNLLAALYQQKGNHSRSEALFRNAVGLAPHEARLWMGLGISLEGQDRPTEALAVYKQAESLADFEIGPRRWLRSRIRDLSRVE